jgi:hypothetical protein
MNSDYDSPGRSATFGSRQGAGGTSRETHRDGAMPPEWRSQGGKSSSKFRDRGFGAKKPFRNQGLRFPNIFTPMIRVAINSMIRSQG